jgi:hypothetical protein
MRRSGSGLLFVAALTVGGLLAANGQKTHAGYNVTLNGPAVPQGGNFT